ncbi:MAG: hypothetical protein CVU06_07890 [Bacteroidetes bacterium HGW-Bacteroidetes-22]|nr:MAG: hypothetical protein CVU06_07890 [Bacteroidetes bacterium HGW-Bacteroidetes-22]
MAIEIREVTSGKHLREFIRFPYRLYKDNPYWVPPLDFDEKSTLTHGKNPALSFCDFKMWMAYKDNRPVGRIAGIINHKANEIWQEKHARFGWIDFDDDEEVSALLFKTIEEWAIAHKMEAVHGPLGFTDFDKEGMLIEGFSELGTMATNYNHPYYPVHTELAGYQKDTDWIEFEVRVPEGVPEKHRRISELALRRNNLTLYTAKTSKQILPYASQIFDLINLAYKDLYGFVPVTDKQKEYYTKTYFSFIKAEYVPIILNKDNKVVGFGITMPSLSKALQKAKGKLFPFGFFYLLKAMRNNDRVDFYLMAVAPELQNKGVNAALFTDLIPKYINARVKFAETNIELEDNQKVTSQWEYFDRRMHKKRRAYIKHLLK